MENRSSSAAQYQAQKFNPIDVFGPEFAVIAHNKKLEAKSQEKWWLLPKTGFNVAGEINRWNANITEGIREGKSVSDIISISANQTKEMLYGFSEEYLRGGNFLPFLNAFKHIHGEQRLVWPRYNDAVIVNGIDQRERGGAVVRSLKKLEDELRGAPVGTKFIRTSPKGPSGLDTQQKKEVCYPDTQTQVGEVVIVNGRKYLRGFSLVLNLDTNENRRLMESFGFTFGDETLWKQRTEQNKINAISEALVIIPPGKSMHDIVHEIEEVTEGKTAKGKFAEVYEGLSKYDQMLQVDLLTAKYSEKFSTAVSKILEKIPVEQLDNGIPSEIRDLIEKMLGTAVLGLAYAKRTGLVPTSERAMSSGEVYNIHQLSLSGFNVLKELERVQAMGGCNGGGSESAMNTPFGMRSITTNPLDKNNKEEIVCTCGGRANHFHCPGNKEKTCTEIHYIGKGITECKSCGAKRVC